MGKTWEFEIPFRLIGYKASISGWAGRGYTRWKANVRLLANVARVPDVAKNLSLLIHIFWRSKRRIDGKNVLGAIEDALWQQDREMVAGAYRHHPNSAQEWARVLVWEDAV